MPDRGEARAMVDQMLELITEMNAAERAKRELALGTPEFIERAIEVERIARTAFRWSQMQLQMGERAAERRARGELTDTVRLIDVEPRPLDVVLSHWREAQLRLEIARPGSHEAQAAADDVERLREEYQAGFERKDGQNVVPMTARDASPSP
jgi:hypothetical protein